MALTDSPAGQAAPRTGDTPLIWPTAACLILTPSHWVLETSEASPKVGQLAPKLLPHCVMLASQAVT